MDEMKCEECGKDFDNLVCKSAYAGNKEDRWFCLDCYKKVHGEEFDEKAE